MARPKAFDCDEALMKAMGVFWSRGYTAASIEDLVAGMGISRQSLYDTFGDKHSLFLKSLDRYCTLQMVRYREALANANTAKAAFRKLFEIEADRVLSDSGRVCFIGTTALEFSARCLDTTLRVNTQVTAIERLFQKRIRRDEIRADSSSVRNPRAVARFLYSSLQGLVMVSASTGNRYVANDIINVTLSILD